MKKLTITSLSVVALVVLAGLIPFETVLVPEWRVTVVDENGNPFVAQKVVESCESYTLSEDPCTFAEDGILITDQQGKIVFPERRITLNLWTRLYRSVRNALLILAHESYGTDVHLSASGPDGYALLEYKTPGTPPPLFVLPSRRE